MRDDEHRFGKSVPLKTGRPLLTSLADVDTSYTNTFESDVKTRDNGSRNIAAALHSTSDTKLNPVGIKLTVSMCVFFTKQPS